MNVALIELDFHVDSVDGICKVFEDSEHTLHVFTTKQNHKILQSRSYFNKHHWILLNDKNKLAFLHQHESKINSCDGIFINTISSDFKVFAKFNFRPVTLLRIHNAYKIFAPFSHIKIYPTLLGIWKALSYFIREVILDSFWYYRKEVVKKIDYFTFPDEAILEYCLEKKLVPVNKIAPVLPIKVFDETVELINEISDEIQITIPGGVDKRRRQYEPVVEAFKLLVHKTPKKLCLHLLGKCNSKYGRWIISEFKKLENDNFRIVFYENFVSQKDFDETMKKTNLIISPVNPDALTQVYGEIYGKTKISGSITDIVLFPKPLILPATYKLNNTLEQLFFRFENGNHLCEIMLDLLNDNDKLKNKTEQTYHILKEKFNKKKVLQTIIDFYHSHQKIN